MVINLLNQITAKTLAAFSTSVCKSFIAHEPLDDANLALSGRTPGQSRKLIKEHINKYNWRAMGPNYAF